MSFRYRALAADYDDTLATDGTVAPAVVDGLRRVRASGRRLVLVTGRELADLASLFPELGLFDRVVAENGAILYRPDTGAEHLLAETPSIPLVDLLTRRGVRPLRTGRAVIAAEAVQQALVAQAIQELGLDLRIILNKQSLMVLPSGIDKARGLDAALRELEIPTSGVVALGDAENDVALLRAVGCGIAVGNAVQELKDAADFVASSGNGMGVLEVIGHLLSSDLETIPRR